ncbi:MAG: polyprenyl synthetase family protein [Armatimonadota bacterium]
MIENGGNKPEFLLSISSELAQVESVIVENLRSDIHTVTDVSSYTLKAGGKRLRPALAILAAMACGHEGETVRLINVASVVEMIHMATLMHDDVIDAAESRRGFLTANSHWGNMVSVLTGDYVVAKAFWILANYGNRKMMLALAGSTIAMSEGELMQIEAKGNIERLINSYFSIIEGKTAHFMSVCCRIGAIAASASKEYEHAIASYGRNLGIAFQITDDILDMVGDPVVIGKPVGGDIREGKVTLPVILTLEQVDASDKRTIEEIINKIEASDDEIDFIRKTAESTGSVDSSRETAARYILQAINDLDALHDSRFKTSLRDLAEYILSRDR